jgi:hypothetical protein
MGQNIGFVLTHGIQVSIRNKEIFEFLNIILILNLKTGVVMVYLKF